MDDSPVHSHTESFILTPPPGDSHVVPREQLITAWNDSLSPAAILQSQRFDSESDRGGRDHVATRSARRHSRSASDPQDLSDRAISVTSAADRGYTDAEAKFRLSQEGKTAIPSLEDISNSPSPTNHNSAALLGLGDHLDTTGPLEKSLNTLLRESLLKFPKSSVDKKWLPFDKLMQLVNENHVYQELCQVVDQDRARIYAKRICESVPYVDRQGRQLTTSCRSIFAILTLMNKVKDAPGFIDAGLSDKHLPLHIVEAETPKSVLRSPPFPNIIWYIPEDWHDSDLDVFFIYHKYMLSPFFKLASKEVFLYELDPNAVLPYIEVGETQRQGHHGSVWQIKIHEAHHDALEQSDNGLMEKNPYFAVKQLNSHGEGYVDFKNEVNAWKKSVGDTNHPHLIRLLATWHQDDCWYLLFPWAHGNLRDYWKENENPQRNNSLVRWMAKQCLGIAEGLKRIHRSNSDENVEFGIHGDIKPENILWFKRSAEDYGTLVICDFGFTRFHNRKSRSNAAPVGVSGTYRAPEIDTLHGHGISRAYDIWTLGCLYLEFTTWYMFGWDGVQHSFAARRVQGDVPDEEEPPTDKFFNCTKRCDTEQRRPLCAEVKPEVVKWIRRLRGRNECSQYFHDLLTVVEVDCLVINRDSRAKCGMIIHKLKKYWENCEEAKNGDDYCVKGLPMPVTEDLSPIEQPFLKEADSSKLLFRNPSKPLHAPQNTFSVDSNSTFEHQRHFVGLDEALTTNQGRLIRSPSLTGTVNPAIQSEATPLLKNVSERPSNGSFSSPNTSSPGRFRQGFSAIRRQLDSLHAEVSIGAAVMENTSAITRNQTIPPFSGESSSNRVFKSVDEANTDMPGINTAWAYFSRHLQHWCRCFRPRSRGRVQQ